MHFLLESPAINRVPSHDNRPDIRRFVDPELRWTLTTSANHDREPFWVTETPEHLLLILGEPIVDEGIWLSLQSEIASTALSTARVLEYAETAVARAAGTYTLVLIDKIQPAFHLIGDPLGVRPFYWAVHSGVIVISSQREGVANRIGASPDEIGIIERAAFGVPLGDRTVHRQVHRSSYNQRLLVRLTGDISSDTRPPIAVASPASIEETTEELGARFRAAIAARYSRERHALATLSGGLDSRAVVASLLDLGYAPACLSFGTAPSLDRQLAEGFARHAGLSFYPQEFPHARRISWAMRIRRAATQLGQSSGPLLSWSGDGGSVCVGGVYLEPDFVSQFDTLDTARLAEVLLELKPLYMPSLLFTPIEKRHVRASVLDDLAKSLADATSGGASQAFRWLVQEDQRRHLDDHFELEPFHGVHYLLPFFDRRVIELMLGVPTAWVMRHRLYMRWVREHLPAVVQTPWQSYPSHEPCDLPLPPGINQWSREAADRNRRTDDSIGRSQLRRWVREGCNAPTTRRRIGMLAAAGSAELGLGRGDTLRMLATDLAFPNAMGGH